MTCGLTVNYLPFIYTLKYISYLIYIHILEREITTIDEDSL